MNKQNNSPNRRTFLKASGTAAAAAGAISFPTVTFGKPDSRKLKIGFIGCGGRGTGAAAQALNAVSSPVEKVSTAEAKRLPLTIVFVRIMGLIFDYICI